MIPTSTQNSNKIFLLFFKFEKLFRIISNNLNKHVQQ